MASVWHHWQTEVAQRRGVGRLGWLGGRGPPAPRRADLPVELYAAHGGSFPIRIRDVGVVGAVTVSGLPQAADHALVVEALRTFLS